MILNLIETESSKLVLGNYYINDDKHCKLQLISAGVSFVEQKNPWLLQVFLEDALGKRMLDCVLIAQGVDFFNFKFTNKVFYTLRTQNLDQVYIIFQAKHGFSNNLSFFSHGRLVFHQRITPGFRQRFDIIWEMQKRR